MSNPNLKIIFSKNFTARDNDFMNEDLILELGRDLKYYARHTLEINEEKEIIFPYDRNFHIDNSDFPSDSTVAANFILLLFSETYNSSEILKEFHDLKIEGLTEAHVIFIFANKQVAPPSFSEDILPGIRPGGIRFLFQLDGQDTDRKLFKEVIREIIAGIRCRVRGARADQVHWSRLCN